MNGMKCEQLLECRQKESMHFIKYPLILERICRNGFCVFMFFFFHYYEFGIGFSVVLFNKHIFSVHYNSVFNTRFNLKTVAVAKWRVSIIFICYCWRCALVWRSANRASQSVLVLLHFIYRYINWLILPKPESLLFNIKILTEIIWMKELQLCDLPVCVFYLHQFEWKFNSI